MSEKSEMNTKEEVRKKQKWWRVAAVAGILLFFVFFAILLFWLAKTSSGVAYTADEWGVHWYRSFGKKHTVFITLNNFKNAQDFAYVV